MEYPVESMLQTKKPRISILMAAYNEAKCIEKTLESILSQTFQDWELILVDDGSEDSTVEIIQQFAMRDDRIHLHQNEKNLGLPASLNYGLSMTRGDYIARADADDLNMPERLEYQYRFMEENTDIDVLGTGAILEDEYTKKLVAVNLPENHKQLKKNSLWAPIFFHSSVMIRRQFFEKVGVYDITYPRSQDKELWLRGLRRGCRYANLQQALIKYQTDGYKRSWISIIAMTKSRLKIAREYRIRWGYLRAILSFVLAVLVRMNLRKPRILRHRDNSV